jgi:hypothetical protein
MIIIKKEYRRAKRTKKWLKDGNIIPLSTKEIKAIQNKLYRAKIKREKQPSKINNKYNEDLNNFLHKKDFNYSGCLTYNYNISIHKAYSNALYIFETLLKRGLIDNYYFINEIEDNHNHTHYLLNISEGIRDIEGVIFRLLNCNYDTCKNWIKPINCEAYKINTINYFLKKLEPNYYNFKHQKQIDYWFYNQKNTVKELAI